MEELKNWIEKIEKIKDKHSSFYFCATCQDTFQTKEALFAHEEKVHNNERDKIIIGKTLNHYPEDQFNFVEVDLLSQKIRNSSISRTSKFTSYTDQFFLFSNF